MRKKVVETEHYDFLIISFHPPANSMKAVISVHHFQYLFQYRLLVNKE